MAMAWVISALALALLGAGVLLWQLSQTGARRAAGAAFIDGRLEAARQSVPSPTASKRVTAQQTHIASLDEMFLRAGIVPTPAYFGVRVVIIGVAALLASLPGGWLGACVAAALTLVMQVFLVWRRADKRQRRMVTQLPVFLDAVVRLITIGSSLGAAFQTASASVDQPLREVMERVAAQNRTGKDLDIALEQTARVYGLKELKLVSAVVAVTLRYGGRSDQVLDRMASFIRDIEQARQELVALSAEVRLSAWILSLLPIGIATYIVVFNPTLIIGMYNDPTGFKMLIAAVVLQVGGSYWLYRLAKSL